MKQELILEHKSKLFKPNEELMDLAEKIRSLKSEQMVGQYTHDHIYTNMRCVIGALMVEHFGASDNNGDIGTTLFETWIPDHGYYTAVFKLGGTIAEEKRTQVQLHTKLAVMNDTGMTFSEIADWVELQAYNEGQYE